MNAAAVRARVRMVCVTLLVAVVATQPACAADSRKDALEATSTASARTDSAVRAAATPLPRGATDSDDCGLLKATAFPDAVELVKHHVALDNDASFLQSTPATDSIYACPTQLPGPDEFTVVRRSDVEPLAQTDSLARVVVRSPRVGRMTQDSVGLVFVLEPGLVVDTFVVRHTPFGWRVESPQLPGRVLGSAVLARPERFPLRAEVRASLAAAMARSPSPSSSSIRKSDD